MVATRRLVAVADTTIVAVGAIGMLFLVGLGLRIFRDLRRWRRRRRRSGRSGVGRVPTPEEEREDDVEADDADETEERPFVADGEDRDKVVNDRGQDVQCHRKAHHVKTFCFRNHIVSISVAMSMSVSVSLAMSLAMVVAVSVVVAVVVVVVAFMAMALSELVFSLLLHPDHLLWCQLLVDLLWVLIGILVEHVEKRVWLVMRRRGGREKRRKRRRRRRKVFDVICFSFDRVLHRVSDCCCV